MEIDFYRDWVAHLKNELTGFGYDTTQLQSPEAVVHAFLNLRKRLVEPVPRAIRKARNFSCPPGCVAGLTEVERKISAGEDLWPHLSRQLLKPAYNDLLLNAWGIHHVHLGTALDADGFVTRNRSEPCSNFALFVRFDDANAYLIDVLPHGFWSKQRLVRELHDNWPDSIEHFRLFGGRHSTPSISDTDVATLRKKRGNAIVDLGAGVAYVPIGGGFSSAGLSVEVVVKHDRYAHWLREKQQAIVHSIEVIAEKAKAKGVAFPESPQFALKIDNGGLYAVEVNCNISVPLGQM